jgi:ectoine hydroxylase-related dioxygenase (phytanoyl-CoA dioxygenase family)
MDSPVPLPPDSRPLRLPTADEVAAYERDGAVKLGGVLGAAWVAFAAAAVDEARSHPGPLARFWRTDPAQSEFYEEAEVAERVPAIMAFICHSPAAELAAAMMRSRVASCVYDQIFIKEPGNVKGTDWHQDLPYFPAAGHQLCVFWMPLEHIDRDNCLEFVRGSHRFGQLYEFAKPSHKPLDLPPMPDVYASPEKYEIITWDMDPGDVIVFHLATFHGSRSRANVATRRRTLSTRWAGDDAVFFKQGRRIASTRRFNLQPGESLHNAGFPQPWPRQRQAP